jgi:ATP-dependent helicase/DNAse subunit B
MRVVRGAPGSGKTRLVLHEFAAALRSGRNNLRILVPTSTLVRHYQHELARSGLIFNPAMVMSLSRFAQECAPGMKLAPAGLLRALVRDTLNRLRLPEFERVATTEGMVQVVIETIRLFENACCTPDRLSKVRNLSPHGKAFLRVWKEVSDAVAARNVVTRGQLFQSAAVAAKSAATPQKLWIDGFLTFSPLESQLLRAIAATCDLTLTLTDNSATDEARRLAMELGASDRLLTGAPRRPQTTAVTAPSPEREADEIARRILQLHDDGMEFPGIAVALRSVETWLPLLRNTFDRFGIPARYYFYTAVKHHPVAAFLNGLIACALSGWDFESTLTALRAHPAWGRTPEFDRFDFRVREAMPRRGAEALLSHCDSPRLRSGIAECLKISSWQEDRARPLEWRDRFQRLAASLYRLPTIPAPSDYAAVDTARSHAAGLRAWSAALDSAVLFLTTNVGAKAEPVSLERFHTAVNEALESATMQIPDNRRNVVHVMSAFEARQWQVKALFICGMAARDYPRRASQNLLFPDTDLERLIRQGIPLRTSADDDRDQEILFDALRTRASETLVFSVSAHDSGGKTILPSRHFAEGAAEKFHLCRPEPNTAEPGYPNAATPGLIGESVLPGLASRHLTVSLTSLEQLAKCRFRFFAERTLTLKRMPERPDARLTPGALGLIVHSAMETWLADRTRDFVAFFEAAFDAFCVKNNIQPGYKLEVERVLLRRIARKVNESVRWPVLSTETEADCSIDFPGGITVTCRVDRIDRLENNDCIIVDYKSGKTTNVKKLVERETSLQGPLYALAVREKKHLNPIAMVFLAVREDKIFGWGSIPGAPDLELIPTPPDWIDNARDRTLARLQSFLAGDVHASPANPDDCTWCDFKNACRIETIEIARPEREEIVKIGVAGGS